MFPRRLFILNSEILSSSLGELLDGHFLNGVVGPIDKPAAEGFELISYRPPSIVDFALLELAREHRERWMIAAVVLNNIYVGSHLEHGIRRRRLVELVNRLADYGRPVLCFHGVAWMVEWRDELMAAGASGLFALPTPLVATATVIRRVLPARSSGQ